MLSSLFQAFSIFKSIGNFVKKVTDSVSKIFNFGNNKEEGSSSSSEEQGGGSIFDTIKDGVKNAIDTVKDGAESLVKNIKDGAKSIFDGIKNIFEPKADSDESAITTIGIADYNNNVDAAE